MTVQQLLTALAVSTPDGQTLWSYDALGDAATGSATGLALLKSNIQVANLVTSGANMLTNDSSLYASFAIIMNQALAKKVSILTSKGACLGQVSPLFLMNLPLHKPWMVAQDSSLSETCMLCEVKKPSA